MAGLEERERETVRKFVLSQARRHSHRLSAAAVEELVDLFIDNEREIARMRRAGLSDEEIVMRRAEAIASKYGKTVEEVLAEAEAIAAGAGRE